MKKTLLVLVIVLTLTLSGCSKDKIDAVKCVKNHGYNCENEIEEELTWSEVSEKVVRWKMLLELHELTWECADEILEENYYLVFEPQVVKFISILEGVEEVIIDYDDGTDFQALETSYINELYVMLQNNYIGFIDVIENSEFVLPEVEPIIEYVEVIVEVEKIVEIEVPVYIESSIERQEYLDWFEKYEELIDGFVNTLYNNWDDADDIVSNVKRWLESKETLSADEVDLLLSITQYNYNIKDFWEYQDTLNDQYNDLMDRFPEEPGE